MVTTMLVGERVAQVRNGKLAWVVVFEPVGATPSLRVFDVVHRGAQPG